MGETYISVKLYASQCDKNYPSVELHVVLLDFGAVLSYNHAYDYFFEDI